MEKLINIEEFKSFISKYKTVQSKKSFITREINGYKDHLTDLTESYNNRGVNSYGWLFGEKIHSIDCKRCQTNIDILNKMYNEIV